MSERINPEAVESAFLDSLFRKEEMPGPGKMPEHFIPVEGIMAKVGFHPARLESHRERVRGWLALLPHEFRAKGGGGWTFLNACNQADGQQWTDFHQRVDQLFMLGIGLGLAKWKMPRDMWDMLPGGMPYVQIEVE